MSKPFSDITIQNNRSSSLRVVIKHSGEEMELSGVKERWFLALGEGGKWPRLTLVDGDKIVEITSLDTESIIIFKRPTGFVKSDAEGQGVWDRELDGGL